MFTDLHGEGDIYKIGFFSVSRKTIAPCKITLYNNTFGYDRCEPRDVVEVFSQQYPFNRWPQFLQDVINDAAGFASIFLE